MSLTIGGPTGSDVIGDPLQSSHIMADYAPQAYSIASQLLAPLYGAGGPMGGSSGFTQSAGLLDLLGGMNGLGMSTGELAEASRAISRGGQQRKAEMAHQLGGASGIDPSTYYRASQGIQRDQDAARANLAAQNTQMGRQNLLQAVSALAPYYKQQMAGQQNYQDMLGGLAGNILTSGNYVVGGQTPQVPTGSLPADAAYSALSNYSQSRYR